MKLAYVALLLLAACGAHRNEALERGTYVSPPAPVSTSATTGVAPGGITVYGPGPGVPGAGATVVGPPQRQQIIPRSKGRVVPQTPHAGLWSDVQAKETPGGGGSSPDDDEKGDLFGLQLPVYRIPGLTIDESADLTYQCAALMTRAVDELGSDHAYQATVADLYQMDDPAVFPLAKGSRKEREYMDALHKRFHCLAASLYGICAAHAAKKPVKARDDVEPVDLRRLPDSTVGRLLREIARLVEDKCPRQYIGAPGWDAIPKIVEKISRQYPTRGE